MGKKYKQQSGIELDTRYIIGPITSIFSGWCGTWKLCVSMFKHFKRQITMITQIRMICPSNNHDVYRLVVSQIRNHPTCWFIIGAHCLYLYFGMIYKRPHMVDDSDGLFCALPNFKVISYHISFYITDMSNVSQSLKRQGGCFQQLTTIHGFTWNPYGSRPGLPAPAPPRKSQDVTEMTPLYRVSWRISSRFGGSKWRFPLW